MVAKSTGSKQAGLVMKRPSAAKKAVSASAPIKDKADTDRAFIQRATSGGFAEMELDRFKAKSD